MPREHHEFPRPPSARFAEPAATRAIAWLAIEVTFSAIVSQISSKHGKTKGTNDSPDMLTLRLSKNIAEQVTSGPMAGHPVTPGWPTVRGRVALSSPVDKVGIEIGQLEDGGSNGDDIMSIVAIDS